MNLPDREQDVADLGSHIEKYTPDKRYSRIMSALEASNVTLSTGIPAHLNQDFTDGVETLCSHTRIDPNPVNYLTTAFKLRSDHNQRHFRIGAVIAATIISSPEMMEYLDIGHNSKHSFFGRKDVWVNYFHFLIRNAEELLDLAEADYENPAEKFAERLSMNSRKETDKFTPAKLGV